MTAPINPRYSEAIFRRIEPMFLDLTTKTPSVVLNPTDLGYKTTTRCAQAIRDAAHSYIEYGWSSPLSHTSFVTWWRKIVVREQKDGYIYVGYRNNQPTITTPTLSTIQEPTNAQLHTLCRLAHDRALTNVVRVKITPDTITEMEAQYDVAFDPIPGQDGVYLLR